jgi:hypothetical protein
MNDADQTGAPLPLFHLVIKILLSFINWHSISSFRELIFIFLWLTHRIDDSEINQCNSQRHYWQEPNHKGFQSHLHIAKCWAFEKCRIQLKQDSFWDIIIQFPNKHHYCGRVADQFCPGRINLLSFYQYSDKSMRCVVKVPNHCIFKAKSKQLNQQKNNGQRDIYRYIRFGFVRRYHPQNKKRYVNQNNKYAV